jgi:hypothetical protein
VELEALAGLEDPVVPAVQAALVVPENPVVLVAPGDPVVRAAPGDPVVRAALAGLVVQVVVEPERVPVVVELELVPAEAVRVLGHLRAQLVVQLRTKSVIAVHHRGRVPLLAAAEDLAAAAETTRDPAATEAATAWVAAV